VPLSLRKMVAEKGIRCHVWRFASVVCGLPIAILSPPRSGRSQPSGRRPETLRNNPAHGEHPRDHRIPVALMRRLLDSHPAPHHPILMADPALRRSSGRPNPAVIPDRSHFLVREWQATGRRRQCCSRVRGSDNTHVLHGALTGHRSNRRLRVSLQDPQESRGRSLTDAPGLRSGRC